MLRMLLLAALGCIIATFSASANEFINAPPHPVTAEQIREFDQETSDEEVARALINAMPVDASINNLIPIWHASANAMVSWRGQGLRSDLMSELFHLTVQPDERLAKAFYPMYEKIYLTMDPRTGEMLTHTLLTLSNTSENRRQQALELCHEQLLSADRLQFLNSMCAVNLTSTTNELEQLTAIWQQLNTDSGAPMSALLGLYNYATNVHHALLEDFTTIFLNGKAFHDLTADSQKAVLTELLGGLLWDIHMEGANVQLAEAPLQQANELLKILPSDDNSLSLAAIEQSLSDEILNATADKRLDFMLVWLNELSPIERFLTTKHAQLRTIFAVAEYEDYRAIIESSQLELLQASTNELASHCKNQKKMPYKLYGFTLTELHTQLFEEAESLLFGLYDNRFLPIVEQLESLSCSG